MDRKEELTVITFEELDQGAMFRFTDGVELFVKISKWQYRSERNILVLGTADLDDPVIVVE